jgi:hypothetical protein
MLRGVYDTFTEGFTTADLIEATELVESPASALDCYPEGFIIEDTEGPLRTGEPERAKASAIDF